MPPRKKSTRAAQANPQPTVTSDYDDTDLTDATASAMAPPPPRSNNELNLTVLRRYVSDIDSIVEIAPFAVVYLFSPETHQWEKCGIEGTLFVCQLSGAQPRYNVVILNRKSMDNFVTELFKSEDVDLAEEYVILRTFGDDDALHIYGIWIFEDAAEGVNAREKVASAIQECAAKAEQGRDLDAESDGVGVPEAYNLDGAMDAPSEVAAPVRHSEAGQQIDVMSLFGKPLAPTAPTQTLQSETIPQRQPSQPAQFTATADTNFFRSSASPAATQQYQSQPQTQQNLLRDMFNSAKRG